MSKTTAKPASSAPQMQAEFNFGTKEYTAIWTASDVALIGKSTISVGGPAVQLSGGWASLDASRGVLKNTGLIPDTITPPTPTTSTSIPRSTSAPAEIEAGSAVVPLESTTLTVIAMASGLFVDSVTIDTAGFQWVIGSQTLSPEDNGIVVASDFKKEVYAYRLITVTSGAIPTGPVSPEATPSPATKGNVADTAETTFSSTATATAGTGGSLAETVAQTAAVTTTPGSGPSLRGTKVALLALVSLLVGLLAT